MSAPTARTTGEITTGEIEVHRCTMTVVRSGGWSWGPDPRGLVRQVVDALPEVLEDHFAEHLAGDGPDVEITEPVTVTVRPGGPGRTGRGGAPFEVHVAPVRVAELPADRSSAEPMPFEEAFLPVRPPWSPPPTGALFTELAERNELDTFLALLPDHSLHVYLLALLGDDDASAGRLLAELARRALLIGAMEALTEVLPEPLRDAPPGEALTEFFRDHVASADREEVARLAGALLDAGGLPDQPGRTAEPPSPAAGDPPVSRTTAREVRVRSVLPFLLAGPLARIGYLDAIGPALAGIELAEEAPLFAAALAYKVLGATVRGWRRTEQDREAAAVFAGLDPPVPEERLTDFARQAGPALPLLDGVLAFSVCRGHDPADPLLIAGRDDGLLMVDAQGMFPIAWTGETARLLPYWQACGRPPVLICDGPLPPGALRELAAAGVPFMTAVRPLRGDPVTRLPWRTPLWTTGDGLGSGRPDPRLATELPGHAARLADLVTALTVERRAIPLADDGGLERTVTLAATLGLSTIAWTLWQGRETPHPLLSLSRFADLEATVRFEPDVVRVSIPLGRRHADLLRGGLLADVPDVVWLDGRTLTFSGG
ncbi:hypothetical protein ACFS5L_24615 [Streptomyces phyllanthi]|uniref:Uncharacterized protein n=1 Tax=Streptomyces phyllanthi TaxID=1803180 RepID=A0A5N8WC62_9ACTN|nr:hypothetical protein [Streptomyces phyllanthi]MPY43964.1 hypothetical protein [Streptomyces phyllanthi]